MLQKQIYGILAEPNMFTLNQNNKKYSQAMDGNIEPIYEESGPGDYGIYGLLEKKSMENYNLALNSKKNELNSMAENSYADERCLIKEEFNKFMKSDDRVQQIQQNTSKATIDYLISLNYIKDKNNKLFKKLLNTKREKYWNDDPFDEFIKENSNVNNYVSIENKQSESHVPKNYKADETKRLPTIALSNIYNPNEVNGHYNHNIATSNMSNQFPLSPGHKKNNNNNNQNFTALNFSPDIKIINQLLGVSSNNTLNNGFINSKTHINKNYDTLMNNLAFKNRNNSLLEIPLSKGNGNNIANNDSISKNNTINLINKQLSIQNNVPESNDLKSLNNNSMNKPLVTNNEQIISEVNLFKNDKNAEVSVPVLNQIRDIINCKSFIIKFFIF